jgi:hypothetical protein
MRWGFGPTWHNGRTGNTKEEIMKRDAIVINYATGNQVWDIDPLPLTTAIGDGMIDASDTNACSLMWSAEMAMQDAVDTIRFTVVWADTHTSPMFTCPSCSCVTIMENATVMEVTDDGAPGADEGVVFDTLICLGCM